jgi:phage shock protein A
MIMEKRPEDLAGLDTAGARDYIFQYSVTLKLTEKKIAELEAEWEKWNSRTALARSMGTELVHEAERQAETLAGRLAVLRGEAAELRSQIAKMQEQLPHIAAGRRNIDTDLLQQELLMAAGHLPGDEEKAETDRVFREIEKNSSADSALEELKAKLTGNNQNNTGESK